MTCPAILPGRRRALLALACALPRPARADAALPSRLAARRPLLAAALAGERIVACGVRGHVVHSDDGGASWAQGQVPTDRTLTGLRFVDARRGFAVGHGIGVLGTQDGGATWQRLLDGAGAIRSIEETAGEAAAPPERLAWLKQMREGGADKPLFDLLALDAERLLVVGAYNLAFHTSDGGRRWAAVSLPNERGLHLYGLARHGRRVLAVGEQGYLARSDDDGQRFERIESPYPGSWFGALALAGGRVLAYGLKGHVVSSDDFGRRWRRVPVETGAAIVGGYAAPGGLVLLADSAGQVHASLDGGERFRSPSAQRAPFPLAAVIARDREGKPPSVLGFGMGGVVPVPVD